MSANTLNIESFYNEEGRISLKDIKKFCKKHNIEYESSQGVYPTTIFKIGNDSYYGKKLRREDGYIPRDQIEVLMSTFAKKAGIDTAEYFLADFTEKKSFMDYILGEVKEDSSSDIKDGVVSTAVMSTEKINYIQASRLVKSSSQSSLKAFRQLALEKEGELNFSEEFFEDYIKFALFDFVTGQIDKHPNNYFLKVDKETNTVVGIKNIDYALSALPVDIRDIKKYKDSSEEEKSKKNKFFGELGYATIMGIEKAECLNEEFLNDLEHSREITNPANALSYLDKFASTSIVDVSREIENKSGFVFNEGLAEVLDGFKNARVEVAQKSLSKRKDLEKDEVLER